MLSTGLLSVTFRQLDPARIIALTAQADLNSIEWGGDIHVPPGDMAKAKHIRQMSLDAGLSISAYGSYYRLGTGTQTELSAVLDTTEALGAPIVRVWAGERGSAEADSAYRQMVIEDAQYATEQATRRNIVVSLEYHGNTLTDTLESTLSLLQAVDHPNLRTYWQPEHTPDLATKTHSLRTLLPWLTNVHVFHWEPHTHARYPLVDGVDDWRAYIDILKTSDKPHVLSLEFVRDDDEATFLEDARTLQQWLAD
ncbi:MAG: xylose isomerase [Anaerolineaceae bacterium]|nr:xylose isomerase [Anaerolineaceae bacterium]